MLQKDWLTAVTSLGDLKFKPFGVTPEPEVRVKLLEGTYLICCHFYNSTVLLLRPGLGIDSCRLGWHLIESLR